MWSARLIKFQCGIACKHAFFRMLTCWRIPGCTLFWAAAFCSGAHHVLSVHCCLPNGGSVACIQWEIVCGSSFSRFIVIPDCLPVPVRSELNYANDKKNSHSPPDLRVFLGFSPITSCQTRSCNSASLPLADSDTSSLVSRPRAPSQLDDADPASTHPHAAVFPAATRAVLRHILPRLEARFDHVSFGAFGLFCNIRTPLRADVRNEKGELNYVSPLCAFRNGEIWVEQPQGPDKLAHGDTVLEGYNMPVAEGPCSFDPARRHCTQDWEGSRIVCVCFTPARLEALSRDDAKVLHLDCLADATHRDLLPVPAGTWSDEASPLLRERLDLLTVETMSSTMIAEILAARGCTYMQLRKRGMDLWGIQTITDEVESRKDARDVLESRLRDASVPDCINTFGAVLSGRERELFDRFLFVLAVVEHADCDDQTSIGVALQCLDSEQRSRGVKRKLMSLQPAEAQGCTLHTDECGATVKTKRLRADRPSLEELVVMVGLASVPPERILECGAALYCEAQRRPKIIAQRYAVGHIQKCLPQASPSSLIRFFYYLLGDAVFTLLCNDLCSQAAVRPPSTAAEQQFVDVGVRDLIGAYQEVVEQHARNHTAFERRHRVRQLEDAVMQAPPTVLAQTFYGHLEPNELDAWSQKLHALGREDLWRPL